MPEPVRTTWQRWLLAFALGPTTGVGLAHLLLAVVPLRANVAYLQLFYAAFAAIGFLVASKLLMRPGPEPDEEAGWHSDAVQREASSRVFSAFNPAEARLASHMLEQAGIPFRIRNESVTFLRGELPMDDCWVEIWVPTEWHDQALEAINVQVETAGESAADDDRVSKAERTTRRALRAALVGLLVLPPLLHPYALSLCLSALRAEGALDRAHRIRLVAAAAVSLGVLALAVLIAVALGLPRVSAPFVATWP